MKTNSSDRDPSNPILVGALSLDIRDGKDNFWTFSQIRDSITKGQFFRNKNPVMEFMVTEEVCRAFKFCRVGFESSLRSEALQVLDTQNLWLKFGENQ